MKTPASISALAAALLLALAPVTASAGPSLMRGPGSGPGPSVADSWSWPLNPRPAVVRGFDPPARPWLSGHRGVDLRAAYDAAPVTSPAAGTVSFVGVVVDRPVITVDHGNGLRSSFEAVRSVLGAGAAVEEGDVLGWILPGHCGPEPCIHWGVRRGEAYLNPMAFVTDLRPSILLPPKDPAPG
ncbi:M23 family metallopeptidase [Arthrobacter sp. U41]|uniref:M23 family metallopeptidase n=1 Tax=Arthrobacter sp. U41 TaxID=1849032 RepID=UPI00085956E1|nr:peptidoglycan DD-metalloendopeptidase family protein [Arthrobacter sp. U41]AOT03938.1 peptidase M23 [Arthrobacter sp. U41]